MITITNNNRVRLNSSPQIKNNSKPEILAGAIEVNKADISGELPFSSLKANFLTQTNCSVLSFKAKQPDLFNQLISSKGGLSTIEENPTGIYAFIKKHDAAPAQVRDCLDRVLENDRLRDGFIKEITEKPRESAQITTVLIKKLGGRSKFKDWYLNSYLKAFKKFTERFYTKAETIEEMLKFSPNWRLDILQNKYAAQMSKKYAEEGNRNFVIGEVPEEFGSRENFYSVIDNLANRQSEESGNIDVDRQTYGFEKLRQFWDKLTYKVTTNGKNYIVKIDEKKDYFDRMRADSVYIDSAVDYYLNANNCKNTAKIHFYDYSRNAALYEFVEGNPPQSFRGLNLWQLNKKLPDLNSLGIYINDPNLDNFIINTGERTPKLINSGHVTYFDPLKPGSHFHLINLPNYLGTDVTKLATVPELIETLNAK